MKVAIKESSITFKDPESRKVTCQFPLSWIRRYGNKVTKINFEIGRRCPNGEGIIALYTKNIEDCEKIISMFQNPTSLSREDHQYDVLTLPSQLANQCKIVGIMRLFITATNLTFIEPESRKIRCQFPLSWIRKSTYRNANISFEFGRHCTQGEGIVTCNTKSAKLIHTVLNEHFKLTNTVVLSDNVPQQTQCRKHEKHVQQTDGLKQDLLFPEAKNKSPQQEMTKEDENTSILLPNPTDTHKNECALYENLHFITAVSAGNKVGSNDSPGV